MERIDLHTHTTASDGTLTPRQLVELAAKSGLRALAVTDHDNHSGCAEAIAAGAEYNVEVLPGIEISTEQRGSIHVLGYGIDLNSPRLNRMLEDIIRDRDDRNRKIIRRMQEDGLPVEYEELQQRFGAVVGRPHFARVLVELGKAESIPDAFARLVGRGCRYYERRHFLSLQESVDLIREAGGVAVLAHPFQYKLDDSELRSLLHSFMDYGLQGMECRYSGYDAKKTHYLEALAEEYGLLKTGGSDFHGENKKHIQLGTGMNGELSVPYEFLQGLKDALTE